MFNMLQDVIKVGTGSGAKKIGRIDLAGKTPPQMNKEMLGFLVFNLT